MDEDDLTAINAAIAANALKPQSATIDGNSVSQQSVGDQIKAAQYAAGQLATGNGHFGLRFSQLVPPGCG